MMGGFCFRRVQLAGQVRFHDVPDKNAFSHVADAGQYANLALGEGMRSMNQRATTRAEHRAVNDYDVFNGV